MKNPFDLTGKRALITGASRGIGLGCAEGLREAGAEVVLSARPSADLDAAVRSIPGAKAMPCDIADTAAFRAAVEAEAPFHILVNNAGLNKPGPFVEVTEERYDSIFDVNMRGLFFAAQAVAKKMLAANIRGSIINMGSILGHVGLATRTIYCSTKHGVEGFTKALALELAPNGIRVNSVAPTLIETPMAKWIFDDKEMHAAVLKTIPIGRVGQPSDVAAAVIYLASDAAGMVTGTCLKVDGGTTAD